MCCCVKKYQEPAANIGGHHRAERQHRGGAENRAERDNGKADDGHRGKFRADRIIRIDQHRPVSMFSSTCACTSTPDIAGSTGVVLMSRNPTAEVPISTSRRSNAVRRHAVLQYILGRDVAVGIIGAK